MGRAGIGVLLVGAILLALVVAYFVPSRPELSLAAAMMVLGGVLALAQPVTLPLLAMPLIVVGARVGPGALSMSLADFALAAALIPAVLFAPRPYSPELRRLLWYAAIFQVDCLFALVANPFRANVVDWFHNWLIVGGGLIVGWAVGRAGAARVGVLLFLSACLLLAIAALGEASVRYASGNFSAFYPSWIFSMHKNFFGNLMCFAALVAYARPSWMKIPRPTAHGAFWIFVAGLGVSQSRQAIVGLAVGLLIVAVLGRKERARGWLAIIVGVPALVLVGTLVRDQVQSGNQHNSFFQRLEWYEQSLTNWQSSPFFGLGLRYWTEGRGQYNFHPPQVFLEVLATTGLVGLVGFLVMIVGMLRTVFRVSGVTGSLVACLADGQIGPRAARHLLAESHDYDPFSPD